jgi:uncharacterized repeat protein (TIGR03803 family)
MPRFSRALKLFLSAASLLVATAFYIPSLACGQSFTDLYSFNTASGYTPYAGVVLAPDGNFYIGTHTGGTGDGTILRLTPSGGATVLHNFAGTDGSNPSGNLAVGIDGKLYGATIVGGQGSGAAGTFYSITTAGSFNSLYTFVDATLNSYGPSNRIIQTSDGTFYGVTVTEGAHNNGSVFSVTTSGTASTLYSFAGGTDQKFPGGGVIEGSDGNFYGTTSDYIADGGSAGGYGVVYQLTPAGKITILHTFDQTDGEAPTGPLVQGADGYFYGTTTLGGSSSYGVIYKVSSTGSFEVLHNFTHVGTDGGVPSDGIMLAADGNFYGGSVEGGDGGEGSGGGTIFKMTPSGTVTTIYNFCALSICADGEAPYAPPTQGTDGNLYGTASKGGADSVGAFYKLTFSPALPAPVKLSFSPATISLGNKTTLTWVVPYVFSKTEQLCAAYSESGAGSWSGVQSGSLSGNNYGGSASITPTATGSFTYTLTCGGHKTGTATLTVTASTKKTSSTVLTATPNPATVGQSVTLKATVSGSGGTPTGTAAIDYSTIVVDTVHLASGAGSFAASSNGIAPATYPLTAAYSGDSNFEASTSSAVNVKLNKAPTTTNLTASPDSVTPPAAVTLTATVARPSGSAGKPTGSVTFLADGSPVATVAVNASGVAKLDAPTNGIAAGTYAVTAKYSGDSSDTASTSAAVNVMVK